MASEFKVTRKVEFVDTDLAGIVHFSRFFVFMETAEHQFLNSLGTSVATKIDGNTIGWPRLSAKCEYVRPMHFEDSVDIYVKVERVGTKSVTYRFEFRLADEVVARGEMATACCVCNIGEPLRAIAIPEELAAKMRKFT